MGDIEHSVARGLDPRAYPLRRPDGVWAAGRVDARVKPAHDETVARLTKLKGQ
jgi:hypothetical protein